ncbi:MAG: aldo/keto reductase [Pseudomonadota bacterium]|nr:aldo/keto reductase [Pseudomonadota bacterium]
MPGPTLQPTPTVRLADGTLVPALGLGTWRMGEVRRHHTRELAALKAGIEAGITLFDTAEMYGDGGAEELLAQAIAGRRDEMFLVSKVYPHNAGAKSAIAACERSLRRLATDRLDLYLLHWRGRVPLAETVDAFERLRRDGKILRWGVSNFDVADVEELLALPEGLHCAVNQVLYHLGERGIEWALAALCRSHAIALMAYSPFGEGALLQDPKLVRIARSIRATPSQVALAWLLRHDDVIAIPQTSNIAHVAENCSATSLRLSRKTLAELDAAFPPPSHAQPLAVI